MRVVWVRDDHHIPDCLDFRYEEEGNGNFSLVIRDVFPEDAGVYICEAYNASGDAHSYCRLSVYGTPVTWDRLGTVVQQKGVVTKVP